MKSGPEQKSDAPDVETSSPSDHSVHKPVRENPQYTRVIASPAEKPTTTPIGGSKFDTEKVQLELLSPPWLLGVGKVLTFGARKYASHNWRRGIASSRLLGAALRHVLAYLGGEDLDPESGLSHLYHASCCLMFASELAETHPELDDRYRVPKARNNISQGESDPVSKDVGQHDCVSDSTDSDPRGPGLSPMRSGAFRGAGVKGCYWEDSAPASVQAPTNSQDWGD